jgi:hypothetical protein
MTTADFANEQERLDRAEQVARIEKLVAETHKLQIDTNMMPWAFYPAFMLSAAAVLGAIFAGIKVFVG